MSFAARRVPVSVTACRGPVSVAVRCEPVSVAAGPRPGVGDRRDGPCVVERVSRRCAGSGDGRHGVDVGVEPGELGGRRQGDPLAPLRPALPQPPEQGDRGEHRSEEHQDRHDEVTGVRAPAEQPRPRLRQSGVVHETRALQVLAVPGHEGVRRLGELAHHAVPGARTHLGDDGQHGAVRLAEPLDEDSVVVGPRLRGDLVHPADLLRGTGCWAAARPAGRRPCAPPRRAGRVRRRSCARPRGRRGCWPAARPADPSALPRGRPSGP